MAAARSEADGDWWYRKRTGENFGRLARPGIGDGFDVVTHLEGEVEVPPIHLRPLPGRKSKIRLGLDGDGALCVVTSMEAPSWEAWAFGGRVAMGEVLCVSDPTAAMVWRLAGGAAF